jgi:hypothetical protein
MQKLLAVLMLCLLCAGCGGLPHCKHLTIDRNDDGTWDFEAQSCSTQFRLTAP